VKRLWLTSLKRRSQRASLNWERFIQFVDRFFPPIRTLHPLPCHRFDARLARNNAGVFPTDHVIDVIDGRAQIKSHGLHEMPNWGKQYAVSAAEHFAGSPYDQEAFIRGHVLILVDYLRRIQQK
jgi:hypothetical protein